MNKLIFTYRNSLLVILSAVLVGLSFTFDKLSILMWIGFIPFIYVFLNSVNRLKQGIRYGMLFGSIYYLILLHWIFNLYPLDWMNMSNKDSIIAIVCGWIFISLIEGLIIAVVVGIYPLVKVKDNRFNIIIISFLWVIMEWILGVGVLGFTWGRLAVSQVNTLSLVQSASLFGSLFIGFLIILVNGLLALFIFEYKGLRKIKKSYIVVAGIIFITNMSYGFFRLSQENEGKFIDVAVVQGNIDTAQKWGGNSHKEHLKIYEVLTDQAIKKGNDGGNKIDMVFWPETVLPVNLSYFPTIIEEYRELAKAYDVHFMTGAFHTEFGEMDKEYNAVYSINKNGEVGEQYFKRQLVPFGETLPFKEIFYKVIPALEKANLFGDIEPGKEAVVVDSEYGKVGSVICFESIFSRLVLDTVREGAELIFVATNDSWFKDSKAVYQHNNNSVLRAIETNRYVVRAANTGISSVINNKGEIISQIDPLKRDYVNSKVQFIDSNTLYSKIGNFIVVIAILGIVIIRVIKK